MRFLIRVELKVHYRPRLFFMTDDNAYGPNFIARIILNFIGCDAFAPNESKRKFSFEEFDKVIHHLVFQANPAEKEGNSRQMLPGPQFSPKGVSVAEFPLSPSDIHLTRFI